MNATVEAVPAALAASTWPLAGLVSAPDAAGAARLETALRADRISVVGRVTGAGALQAELDRVTPDAVVLMATRFVIARDATLRLLRRRVRAAIVVVVPRDGERSIRSALEAGVDGLVFDSDVERCLALTVRAACTGQVAIPGHHRLAHGRPSLSARERETLRLVVEGHSNREIATLLFLAESTVKCHLSSAFGKLGVRSRNAAVDMILNDDLGLRRGILGVPPSGADSRPAPAP